MSGLCKNLNRSDFSRLFFSATTSFSFRRTSNRSNWSDFCY